MPLPSNLHKNYRTERSLTTDVSYNHDLDNNDNFSPDDTWLVYDTRTLEGGIGANGRIEKVQVETGEKKIIYELDQNDYGPGVGAASYSHTEAQVVFIHGSMACSADRPYEQWRRSGVIVKDSAPGIPIFMDARNTTSPFTPGALRGGTHRHEFSGDGQWIGFTYNDALLQAEEERSGQPHNLRTIGVSKYGTKVTVPHSESGENFSGEWFSAIVVNVVATPIPGSDQIDRAAGDSWIGSQGYLNADGTLQRARAFLGTVKNTKGRPLQEVFVVDIPEDITVPGKGPLEGTGNTMPSPPQNCRQRRLTYTAESRYPGCEGIVRSSHDGKLLAFLAYDALGNKQVFTISPLGGTPVQRTFHSNNVQGGLRWHPHAHTLVYVWENALVALTMGKQMGEILTEPSQILLSDPVWSHSGNCIAYNKSLPNGSGGLVKQILTITP